MDWEKDRYSFLKGGPAQGFKTNYATDDKSRLLSYGNAIDPWVAAQYLAEIAA